MYVMLMYKVQSIVFFLCRYYINKCIIRHLPSLYLKETVVLVGVGHIMG